MPVSDERSGEILEFALGAKFFFRRLLRKPHALVFVDLHPVLRGHEKVQPGGRGRFLALLPFGLGACHVVSLERPLLVDPGDAGVREIDLLAAHGTAHDGVVDSVAALLPRLLVGGKVASARLQRRLRRREFAAGGGQFAGCTILAHRAYLQKRLENVGHYDTASLSFLMVSA